MKASWSEKIRELMVLAVLVLSVGLSGCPAISYVLHKLAPGGKGKWVAAQSEALSEGKKVLILVYADENIQYQHGQLARYRTAAVVAEQMQSKLKVEVVDPAIVEQFQASDPNWTDRHPSQIGRERYHAELVLYLELQGFTTAAEGSGELLRGRIEGNCSLFTADKSGSEGELLWQKKVKAVYPPNMPQMAEMGAGERIRDETIKLFAENLVKHFYGHYEP